jgi:4-hydroxy-2-oxoheptanedioate aldolase
MTVTYDELGPSDAARCAELEAQLFDGDDPWPAAAFLRELAAQHIRYVAARADDKLVGYAGAARLGRKPPYEYEIHTIGVDPAIPSPMARLEGAVRSKDGGTDSAGRKLLGIGTRGRGSETTAAPIWGLSTEEYMARCDPWPLNPEGELLLGVKLESPEGIANCEAILDVPGLGFAELGPGDLGLSLGYRTVPRQPFPPEMKAARERVLKACRARGIAFLEGCAPDNIASRIDEGVRVVAGHNPETARAGRAHQKRAMPV